jgi:hypothetical protein
VVTTLPLVVAGLKATRVFNEVSEQDSMSYAAVKKALLTAHYITPETARKCFRELRKKIKLKIRFCLETTLHKRWLQGLDTWDDIEALKQMVLLKQFRETIIPDINQWLLD